MKLCLNFFFLIVVHSCASDAGQERLRKDVFSPVREKLGSLTIWNNRFITADRKMVYFSHWYQTMSVGH